MSRDLPRRQNPRARILKRSSRHIADIPLPFNKLPESSKDLIVDGADGENKDHIITLIRQKNSLLDKQVTSRTNHTKDPDVVVAPKKIDSVRKLSENSSTDGVDAQKKVRKARSTSEPSNKNSPNKLSDASLIDMKARDIVKRALDEDGYNRLKFIDSKKVTCDYSFLVR